MLGYLNRIGKKKVCEASFNTAKEMKSLISFASAQPKKTLSYDYSPYAMKRPKIMDPISVLAPEGKRVIEKLRNFIKRDQISEFVNDH